MNEKLCCMQNTTVLLLDHSKMGVRNYSQVFTLRDIDILITVFGQKAERNIEMDRTKWQRIQYQPNLPLYPGRERVTGSAEHIALSRRAAGEGMVLLKNENGTLPLRQGARVALLGKASVDYVKGGGGSGDVTVDHVHDLYYGMRTKEAEGRISVYGPLEAFYRDEIARQYAEGAVPGMTREPELPEELLRGAAAYADTAIVSICRYSGEGWDRRTQHTDEESWDYVRHMMDLSRQIFEQGDYNLTAAESRLVEAARKHFRSVVIVLNVGGMVDSSWFKDDPRIDSVLLAWQGGMEGGLAEADILCGDVDPSGRLTDTLAASLDDYPSTADFHVSPDSVDYTEGIYVGYRYFLTEPGAAQKINYPFGFGLSYTDFDIAVRESSYAEDITEIVADVTNVGACAGREVVQVYARVPGVRIDAPALQLAAYAKTRLLQPGETQRIALQVPDAQLASYDETGAIREAARVLEAGEYKFYIGNSSVSLREAAVFTLEEDQVVEQLHHLCRPDPDRRETPGLERVDPELLEAVVPESRYVPRRRYAEHEKDPRLQLSAVAAGEITLEQFMGQLSLDDRLSLLGGQPNTGVANTYGMGNLPECGIPNMMTADGPAGLRILPECGICTTAWPCATLIACSWDTELAEAVGRAGAEEVKENNIGLWLAPGMNIHRSPLCGRNFEYYSEDPFLAGTMGAAAVRGIQSMHIGACPKHFACNNKETNRKRSDSRVSERALREIYLRPFEIVVRESRPWAIMTAYNKINGVHASENRDLLTGILRGEWGYDGIVTTDWWNQGEHYREILAGNDVKMGTGFPERVKEALEQGLITEADIDACVRRVLEMLMKLD